MPAMPAIGIILVMLFAMDNFFGIPMMVARIFGGAGLSRALNYDAAYGPILSKIGISLLASYHGAQIFEAIGLGADVIDTAFTGTTSRVAGMTLIELANETLSLHAKHFQSSTAPSSRRRSRRASVRR